MIDASEFKTTEDVIAVAPPAFDGSYKCPVCEETRPNRRLFGLHLSHAHKIRSASYAMNRAYNLSHPKNERTPKVKPEKVEKPPKVKQEKEQLTNRIIKFCPNCGENLELHEAAAEVIRRGR